MISAILVLAVIALAYAVYRCSRRLDDFDTRFGLMEQRQLRYLEQKVKDIRGVPKPPQEPAAAKPAQAEPAPPE